MPAAVSDFSSGTTEAFQLDDISVQSLLIASKPILGY